MFTARKIRLDELPETRRLFSLAFEFPFPEGADIPDPEAFARKMIDESRDRAEKFWEETWAAFTETGEMAAYFSALPYTQYFDGQTVPMMGIGGVSSLPQHRRGGAIRRCFEGALRDMYERGTLFSYLYPFNEKFYGKFGYARCCDQMLWTLDMTRLPSGDYPGTFHLYDGGEDLSAFQAVYEACAPRYNSMIRREEYDWAKVRDAKPFENTRYGYLYRNREGRPTGYMVFKKTPELAMDCSEFLFTDREALDALTGFATRFAAYYKTLCFCAPADLDLSYYCDNYAHSLSARQLITNGMTRVVNVRRALELARYRGSGRAVIAVDDAMLPENSGAFRVEFEDGKALSVHPTTDAPDAELPIGAFSAALMGCLPVEQMVWRPDVAVHCPEAVAPVFYRKPNWICNHF